MDVSRWQHPGGASIDWAQVRAAGPRFAFVKATDPVDGTNPYFAADWKAAGDAGLYRGAYHRARPRAPLSTASDQASAFVALVGSSGGPADLPPVLDLEETGGLGPADLVAWAQRWLSDVQRLTGRRPLVYVGYYFWRDQLGATTAVSGYRLWLPQYTPDPQPYLLPSAWPMWTFWQHSNSGAVPGIGTPVDLDRYCCSESALRTLTGAGSGEAAGNPFGYLDGVVAGPGRVTASGWAIDPDTVGPGEVHVYVDGRGAAIVTANGSRPDVGAVFPGYGPDHGYTVGVSGLAAGSHTVCTYAINIASGTTNPLLGCRSTVVT